MEFGILNSVVFLLALLLQFEDLLLQSVQHLSKRKHTGPLLKHTLPKTLCIHKSPFVCAAYKPMRGRAVSAKGRSIWTSWDKGINWEYNKIKERKTGNHLSLFLPKFPSILFSRCCVSVSLSIFLTFDTTFMRVTFSSAVLHSTFPFLSCLNLCCFLHHLSWDGCPFPSSLAVLKWSCFLLAYQPFLTSHW